MFFGLVMPGAGEMSPVLGQSGPVLRRGALADAYCFAGSHVPSRGLVRGRGVSRFRVVMLEGPKVRNARGKAADPFDGSDVFMYRDSSIAPLCGMIRGGVTLCGGGFPQG